METIKQSLVEVWWWLQAADPAVLTTIFVSLTASGGIVSWIVQIWKKRYNIDLKSKGKHWIIAVVTVLSYAVGMGDWILLNIPVNFLTWAGGAGSAIVVIATILHRIHVSPSYNRITGWLLYIATRTDQAAAAKYPISEPHTISTVVPTAPTFKQD